MACVIPNVGDIGIVDHSAISYCYTVVKVAKVTPARVHVCVLQPDGSWGDPKVRKIDRFMFIEGNPTTEDLLAIRDELMLTWRATTQEIENVKKRADADVLMMAHRGKPLGA
jgi:hypothetical protein